MIGGIVAYLVIGVLAGENLRAWLTWLPTDCRGVDPGRAFAGSMKPTRSAS